jgi:hypothetical protein|tara:strand:- start:40 stop:246 length:207 start_codon:yes stop_codon:yes gene_type:complete
MSTEEDKVVGNPIVAAIKGEVKRVGEYIQNWAANRKNNFDLAIDELPYVCVALIVSGLLLGFLLGKIL